MTEKEYQALREKEKSVSDQPFIKLEKSANLVNVIAAVLMAGLWIYAIYNLFIQRNYGTNPIELLVLGCIIGIVGEAASRTMEALAQHMKNTKTIQDDISRLMKRIERK